MIRVTFLGAAETVTGSRYLVETGRSRILVDCGLFQGWKRLRERNWLPLPLDPATLDAVVLTHAHLDHTGFLPRLCQTGFSGPVYCTAGTADLLKILLPDSGHLQEEEARHANHRGYSKHHPAMPLYTREAAEQCLAQIRPVDFYTDFVPAAGVQARFTRAGHILGSGCLALHLDGTALTFSGDVGRPNDPIMKPPDPLSPTDFLVVESTYGDRRHPPEDVAESLAKWVNASVARGGVMLVPAFAVGRAQHILRLLDQLRGEGRIPAFPVYLNSPMSISATEIFRRHAEDHRLSQAACDHMCAAAHYVQTVEESMALDTRSGPMLIIAASGMATGGRILHHFRRFLPDPKNAVLFVGYQAAGTRGASMLAGAEEIKIQGAYVPVRAQVSQIQGLSAHADYAELIAWFRASGISPRRVFVTHGEPAAADAFRRRLRETFGWDAVVPEDRASFELG